MKADLDALIGQVAARLTEHGGSPAAAIQLGRHEVLYEVVGKWPPDAPLKETPAEVESAMVAVTVATSALTARLPEDPYIQELNRLIARLQQCLDQGLVIEVGPPSGGGAGQEPGDAGEDEGVDTEVIGRWPPE